MTSSTRSFEFNLKLINELELELDLERVYFAQIVYHGSYRIAPSPPLPPPPPNTPIESLGTYAHSLAIT